MSRYGGNMDFNTGYQAVILVLSVFYFGFADPTAGQIIVDSVGESKADSLAEPEPATGDTVTATASSGQPDSVDSITIEGLVLDSASGLFPKQDSIAIFIASVRIPLDSQGNFSATIPRSTQYVLVVYSGGFSLFNRAIPDDGQKTNLFVTCMISTKKRDKSEVLNKTALPTDGMPWTISGCIVDSRLDLAISSPHACLTFDDATVELSSKGSFKIITRLPGTHTFHLRIPGYHDVYETVVLTDKDKQPFIPVATTESKYAQKRREITVSAKREPVHTTATVASVAVTRKELVRSTNTLNDPVRVLNALPGIAAESDLSAVPIIRGGDLLEGRVFLDGIPLLQPFHFGGFRSMFNAQGMENIKLFKSGFPAEYHNAQSGLIVAESRSAAKDSAIISGDINLLQYDAYVGIPFNNHTMGLTLASQGSYLDFMVKRAMDAVILSTKDTFQAENLKTAKKQMNQPDYQDYSAGFEWRPSDKFHLAINNLYNTDRMWYTQVDSITQVTCLFRDKLYYKDECGNLRFYNHLTGYPAIDERLRDTSFIVYNYKYGLWDYPSPLYNVLPDSTWDISSYFEIDTMLHYKSGYNLLYSKAHYLRSADRIFSFSAAWQKRWWNLVFPHSLSNFIDTSRYDVSLDQWNVHAGMLYSGKDRHLIKCGLQWDLTAAHYNVYTFRILHEIISKGSTNYGDYWGPVTNDTGLTIGNSSGGEGFDDASWDMIGRLLVSYNGRRLFNNGSIYGDDEWTPAPKLTLNYGGRIEISQSDTSVTFSPRLSLKYQWRPNHELIAAAGLYTQNNYDIAALALSKDLKPEKVWHASVGMESKLLPWLAQKIDLYGKYYFDLTSEEIQPIETINANTLARADTYIASVYKIQDIEQFKTDAPQEYANMVMAYFIQYEMYSSRYSNEGRGWAAGGEYFLRYDPADYWDGWISFTLGKSMRRRHPGWRWHDFPYERPLLISLVNYYRLPRKFEIGVKYRFMSGIPYTPVTLKNGVTIGAYNSKRYAPYQSLDLKIARGFRFWGAKARFYIEAWNMLNTPNMMLNDSKTHELQMVGMNLPFTMLFIGLDVNAF
jgi:outer membrane receptor protein involved in Fe transport